MALSNSLNNKNHHYTEQINIKYYFVKKHTKLG